MEYVISVPSENSRYMYIFLHDDFVLNVNDDFYFKCC